MVSHSSILNHRYYINFANWACGDRADFAGISWSTLASTQLSMKIRFVICSLLCPQHNTVDSNPMTFNLSHTEIMKIDSLDLHVDLLEFLESKHSPAVDIMELLRAEFQRVNGDTRLQTLLE